jgi:hypothetical protein
MLKSLLENHVALVYVQQELTFPGKSFVFIPLISPHQLQQRFKVRERSVFMVVRKSYPLLKSELDSLNTENFSGLYVTFWLLNTA